MVIYFSTLSAAICIFAFIQCLPGFFNKQRQQVLVRLEVLSPSVSQQIESELQAPFSQRVILPGLQQTGTLLARYTPKGLYGNIQRKLIMAGSPGKLGPSEFLGLQGLTGTAGLMAGAAIMKLSGGSVFSGSWGGLGLGLLLPHLYLGRVLGKRQFEIQRSLPNVLDLLTISVEAGLGFEAALAKVVEKLGGALGHEFLRVLQEIKMGKARREALRSMVERVGVEDLAVFIGAVVQAEQLGVGIAPVLRLQSQAMRTKQRQRAEETALKAPIKMLFPLVFFIFPSLFVILLGPAVIQIIGALLGL